MIFDPALVTQEGEQALADLRKVARQRRKDTQAIATRFVLERLLSRLFDSPHADRFVLKGGMIFMFAEEVDPVAARSTGDVDIHIPAFEGCAEELDAIMRDVLAGPDRADGVMYDVGGLKVLPKREGQVSGASVDFAAQVGSLRVRIKCDVGFDARPAHDVSVEQEMPSVLPGRFAPFTVRRIPFSWTLADKVQALVRHGENTTRLRDYYDMFVIVTKGKADPEQAADALRRTFRLFETEMPTDVSAFGALSDGFAERNAKVWAKECKARGFAVPVPDLPAVVAAIRQGVAPLLERAHEIDRAAPAP